MQKKTLKLLSLSLFASTLSCVSIPATTKCSVLYSMSDGMFCANTLTGETYDMRLDQTIEFLEPTPVRAGAICQSADDYEKEKNALEQACRELGPRCTKDIQELLRGM